LIDISVYQGGLPCLTTLDMGDADELTETGLTNILKHTGPALEKLNVFGCSRLTEPFLESLQTTYNNKNNANLVISSGPEIKWELSN